MISLQHVKTFCKDYTKIENYDKAISDTSQTWECHHRMELIRTGAVVDSTKQDLIDWGIYYDRPADELIFLTSAEHRALHHKGNQYSKGHHHSEETKAKIGVAASIYMKGKKRSEETKAKISASMKGKNTWVINKHWKLVDGKRVWY